VTHDENDSQIVLAQIAVSVRHIEADIKRVETSLEHYVRLARFRPIEMAVFGLIGLVFTVLVGIAVVKLMGHP
jgi:hypothetical protein